MHTFRKELTIQVITTHQLQRMKTKLQQRKNELSNQLTQNNHFGTEFALEHESMGELSNYDNHPADNGTDLYEREKDIALNEHAEKELKDINHALAQMGKNQYGKCEECGKDIPPERLEALPTTTFCIEHSPDQIESHSRPVEEEILAPDFGRFEFDEKDATLYDSEDSFQDVARYGTSETPSDFAARDIEHYSQTYVESDEPVSFVEDIEAFTGNDIYGKNVKVYPNQLHEEYEQMLDDANYETIMGDLPYHNTDGYVSHHDKYNDNDLKLD